jgi:2-polyprenyl-6-methoxyphenol hydroxylase-like FAD-dependent oxidoreductase
MRILHLLSQRPEATGSGSYVRAMIATAGARGHENFLPAGIPGDTGPELPAHHCRFVRFTGGGLPFDVVGMSDAMPYDSCRFIDLTDDQIRAYSAAFEGSLQAAVDAFRPDLIRGTE